MSSSEWESLTDAIGLEDEYEIVAELGRGGSAIVYRARDRALGRDVAIKVVRGRGMQMNDEQLARLAREARTVAQLDHPRIVSVYAVRSIPDGLALVMQWVPGRTLKQRIIEEGPLPIPLAEQVLRDVASALAAAHQRGVVHRDVKPENIFLDAQRHAAMLSDFGIAISSEQDTRLTMTGTAIGTPTYMAPELLDGGVPTPRSDVYALGLVAWEMLTGQQPWAGESLYGVIYRQKHDALPPIDVLRADVPERLQYVVDRALQKRAGARWAGGEGVLAQLDGSVLPPDWAAWQAARTRRRALAVTEHDDGHTPQARTAGAPRNAAGAASLPTRRFRRGEALATTATTGAADAPLIASASAPASAPSASVPSDAEDVPDWVLDAEAETERLDREEEHEAQVTRRVWPLAFTAALLLAIAVGLSGALGEWPGGIWADARWREVAARVGAPFRPPPVVPAPEPTARREVPALAPERIVTTSTYDSALVDQTANAAANANASADEEAAGTLDAWPDEVDARPLAPAPRRAAARARTTTAVRSPPSRAESAPAPPMPRLSIASGPTLTAGGRHSCVVQRARVLCWGANEDGQLGNGRNDVENGPVPVRGELPFLAVSAGLSHTCGLVRAGAVYCWGSGEAGQLGDATTTSRTAPVRVASGLAFALVRTGRDHSCALTVNGAVACWGRNHRGQLGDGTTVGRSSPVLLQSPQSFRTLSSGGAHTCALTHDGAAYCWGANDAGQLGDGGTQHRTQPVAVASGVRFEEIATGNVHTCAVSHARDVWCWGRLAGVQRTAPVRVSGPARIRSIVAGTVHSCAGSEAGVVWCWGGNEYGQLGNGTTTTSSSPQVVSSVRRFEALAASGAHTCALAGREVWCWGYNADGQTGSGDSDGHVSDDASRTAVLRPTRVASLTGGAS